MIRLYAFNSSFTSSSGGFKNTPSNLRHPSSGGVATPSTSTPTPIATTTPPTKTPVAQKSGGYLQSGLLKPMRLGAQTPTMRSSRMGPTHSNRNYALSRREGTGGWIQNYMDGLKALGSLKKGTPEAKKALKFLDHLSKEAKTLGRGGVWIPSPSINGYYPKVSDSIRTNIKTAIRKSARPKTRARAWKLIEKAAQEYYPPVKIATNIMNRRVTPGGSLKQMLGELDIRGMEGSSTEKSLLRGLIAGVPVAKGRYPQFLGKKVPGEIGRRTRGSVLKWGEFDKGDVDIGKGFNMMKFSILNVLAMREEFTPDERLSYDAGLYYAFEDTKATAKRGAILGLLGALYQELGIMPPATVDNIPLRRRSFGKGFERMGDADLRAMIRRLKGSPEGSGGAKASFDAEKELAQRG